MNLWKNTPSEPASTHRPLPGYTNTQPPTNPLARLSIPKECYLPDEANNFLRHSILHSPGTLASAFTAAVFNRGNLDAVVSNEVLLKVALICDLVHLDCATHFWKGFNCSALKEIDSRIDYSKVVGDEAALRNRALLIERIGIVCGYSIADDWKLDIDILSATGKRVLLVEHPSSIPLILATSLLIPPRLFISPYSKRLTSNPSPDLYSELARLEGSALENHAITTLVELAQASKNPSALLREPAITVELLSYKVEGESPLNSVRAAAMMIHDKYASIKGSAGSLQKVMDGFYSSLTLPVLLTGGVLGSLSIPVLGVFGEQSSYFTTVLGGVFGVYMYSSLCKIFTPKKGAPQQKDSLLTGQNKQEIITSILSGIPKL